MTDITAFNTPHRPDTSGVRYTLWTTNHDQIAGDLTPCAARLYRWMLQQAAGGVKQTVDLDDFQQSTVCRKRQAGYHIKHILRSFKELVEAGLACVMRWYGHCKRIFDVVVRHSGAVRPIQLLERKNSRKHEEILSGKKKFQSEPETLIPPFSIQSFSKITEQTHPPHPAAVIEKKVEVEEEEVSQEVVEVEEEEEVSQEVMEYETTISEEDEGEEVELETGEQKNPGGINSSDRAKHEEKLDLIDDAGIRLNAQLEVLVRDFTLEEVKNAIAYYQQTKRIKGSKGQTIDRPAGWFTDCLRQNWWKTAPQEKTREEEEFDKWYEKAIASDLVENVPISWLSKNRQGELLVRLRKPGLFGVPYTLVPWRELQKATPQPTVIEASGDDDFR